MKTLFQMFPDLCRRSLNCRAGHLNAKFLMGLGMTIYVEEENVNI